MRRAALACLAAALALLVLAAPAARAAAGPAVESAWASEVLTTSARLEATLVPGSAAILYRFDYLTEAAYAENLAAGREGFAGAARAPAGAEATLPAGESPLTVGRLISGLAPLSAYRFRLAVHGEAGAAESEAQAFTTQPIVPIACEGDACQILPPEPVDPGLTTLIPGLGNPKVRYRKLGARRCGKGKVKRHGRCVRKKHRHRHRHRRHHRRGGRR